MWESGVLHVQASPFEEDFARIDTRSLARRLRRGQLGSENLSREPGGPFATPPPPDALFNIVCPMTIFAHQPRHRAHVK